MKKLIFIIIVFCGSVIAQVNNSDFFHKPYSIYENSTAPVIAGSVFTYLYDEAFNKSIKKEFYSDPHSKPEYLVVELFKVIKGKSNFRISDLYDTTFDPTAGDELSANFVSGYDEIRFKSKFRSGSITVIRYDFVSSSDSYAYFAAIQESGGKYYLTTEVNLSDPFNLIGSYSPFNLKDAKNKDVNTEGMTPFYFVNKDGKVFYTAEMPPDDYSVLYLGLEFYDEASNSRENSFLNKIHDASKDSLSMKKLVSPDQLILLENEYYRYYFSEITKVFRSSSKIETSAFLRINGGLIAYIKAYKSDFSYNIYALNILDKNGEYFVSLKITDEEIKSILNNPYVKEAVILFLSAKNR